MAKGKGFRLTQKAARELIKKEIGIAGKLEVERAGDGVYIYIMRTGRIEITVSNDWYERNGLIDMQITHVGGGGSMQLYFEPNALQEDYDAEDKHRREIREEQCEGCAFGKGARKWQI